MNICIVGSTGYISKKITNFLIKENHKITGISRSSINDKKNYNHIKMDIENDDLDIKDLQKINKSNVIIFSLNKKEKPKNLEYDLNKLMLYHVYFPLRLIDKLNKKKRKIIIINSDAILSKVSYFHYTLSKTISSVFAKYSEQLVSKNLEFTSLMLGKMIENNKEKNEILKDLIINIINTKSSLYVGKNILVYEPDNPNL